MADAPKTPEQVAAELEDALKTSGEIRDALREAVKLVTNAIAVRTNQPVHPGIVIGALMTEAGTMCALWGMSMHRRPDEIEEFFASALRNARRGFRLELQQMLRGQHPIADSGGQTH